MLIDVDLTEIESSPLTKSDKKWVVRWVTKHSLNTDVEVIEALRGDPIPGRKDC